MLNNGSNGSKGVLINWSKGSKEVLNDGSEGSKEVLNENFNQGWRLKQWKVNAVVTTLECLKCIIWTKRDVSCYNVGKFNLY